MKLPSGCRSVAQPVRQALFWLEREGYVEVYFRSGWQVRPFDFAYFEELYDFRIVLEREAIRRLCGMPPGRCTELLADLKRFWIEDRVWMTVRPSPATTKDFTGDW